MNGSYKVRLSSKIFPKLMGVQVLVEMFVRLLQSIYMSLEIVSE